MMIDPFQPDSAATTTCSVTAVSQFFACPGNGECIEINNSGANTVFIETTGGGNPQIAATVAASYPVLPGHSKVIKCHGGDGGITAIASVAGPTVIFVTRGNGI